MIEEHRAAELGDAGFVAFRVAGESVAGDFRCAGCGYGVAVSRELPACPMCAGTAWEDAAWSPVGRTH